MAKYNFVKSCRKDIYTFGKVVPYTSKKGKNEGKISSKLDRTLPKDENDTILIPKGSSYYWWQFAYGPVLVSKTQPRPSQLTQSSFLSTLYEIQERIEDFSCTSKDEFDSFKEELVSDLETLRDETQEKLDNMPESLQSAPSGELLQNRVDCIDEFISEIEFVECEELVEDEDEESDEDDGDSKQQELIDQALDELKNISYNGE